MVGPPSCVRMQDGFFIGREARVEAKRLDFYDYFLGAYYRVAYILFQPHIQTRPWR